jgi:hypothetical protein
LGRSETSAILHDNITALEVNGVAVIEFKPNLASKATE